MNQPHVDHLRISVIKDKHGGKSDKDFVKLKLSRDPKLSTSDLYEFKMSLFENGEPEESFLFVRNFNKTLKTSRLLEADADFQYLCNIVHREALRQFDLLSSDVEITETLNVDYIIRELSQYFPLWTICQNRSSQCAME